MNYEKELNHTYDAINGLNQVVLFFKDNTYYTGGLPTDNIGQYYDTYLDYFRASTKGGITLANKTDSDLVAFYYPDNQYTTTTGYLFVNQFTDYFTLKIEEDYMLSISLVDFDYDMSASAYIHDAFTTASNYLNVSTTHTMTTIEYTSLNRSFTALGQTLLFDNTFVESYIDYKSGNLFQLNQYRENLFRSSVYRLSGPNIDRVSLTYSYSDTQSMTSLRGNQASYSVGYNQGYTDGYSEGFNVGASGVSSETGTAFSYIGQAFRPVETILSLEVLPNITLGLVFSIPLIIVMITLIFKMIKK